jgi:hypothetical protein
MSFTSLREKHLLSRETLSVAGGAAGLTQAGRSRQPAVGATGVGASFATALATRARRISMNVGLPV